MKSMSRQKKLQARNIWRLTKHELGIRLHRRELDNQIPTKNTLETSHAVEIWGKWKRISSFCLPFAWNKHLLRCLIVIMIEFHKAKAHKSVGLSAEKAGTVWRLFSLLSWKHREN